MVLPESGTDSRTTIALSTLYVKVLVKLHSDKEVNLDEHSSHVKS